MEASIFHFSDYRAFLKTRLQSEEESWGLITKMAKAAGCQRSYLSKVLSGEAQLTPAQAYGLAKFWELNTTETEFFLGLLEVERASSSEYKEYILKKNTQLKKQYEDLSERVQRKKAEITDKDFYYYSTWYHTAIHILVSIPEFQTAQVIARHLSLPLETVKDTLAMLENFGFIKFDNGRYQFLAHEQHLPRNAPLVTYHHNNWRNRAVLDAQQIHSEGLHYTVVQSLSEKDYEKIKQMVLSFVEDAAKIAGPSKEEKLMCFCCDLFEV